MHYPLIHRVWNLKLKFSKTVRKGHGNEVFCQKGEKFNFFVKLSPLLKVSSSRKLFSLSKNLIKIYYMKLPELSNFCFTFIERQCLSLFVFLEHFPKISLPLHASYSKIYLQTVSLVEIIQILLKTTKIIGKYYILHTVYGR